MSKLKKIAGSGVMHFVLLRYGTLVIQFVNALVIAELLGAYYFGIYSFVMLVVQYLSYSNLGINYSLNVALSTKKKTREFSSEIWGNTLLINHYVSIALVVIGLAIYFVEIPYLQKYDFKRYLLPVLISSVLVNYNSLFVNSFRVHGKLSEINLSQILPPLATVALLPFFRGEALLNIWIWVFTLANLISFVVFVARSPYEFRTSDRLGMGRILLTKGIHLLFYNVSFFFIMMSARTVISVKYPVEDLGYFSFANSIANSVMLAGGAFAFVFFSKIVNRLNAATNEQAVLFLKRIRITYVTLLNLLVLISMLFVPLVGYFLPQMEPAQAAMMILLSGQLINNTNMGNTSFLIAKGKERTLTGFGFQAIGAVVAGALLVSHYGGSIQHIALVVILASAFYSYRAHRFTGLFLKSNQIGNLAENVPIYVSIILVLLAIYFQNIGLVFLSLITYVILEWKNLRKAIAESVYLITTDNASVID